MQLQEQLQLGAIGGDVGLRGGLYGDVGLKAQI